ncbi:hypothetical protein BTK96_002344 [Burkholderia pyrrocinia]|uniref:hypothetical protein n=1 Tax=Burkholderia sp. IT-111MI5 TaxID=3026439 RepID=UPI002A2C4EBC|nr:hypothetical protein [Burkholderia pyrrocinia]EKS9894730.1 hypothetical protein [Burkholderia pyrrocinia]EKS9907022.1 hypothetical protein [Burkholderia pyrrocinia]
MLIAAWRVALCGAGRAGSANGKQICIYRGIVQDSDHVDWRGLLIRQAPAGKFLKWRNRGFARSRIRMSIGMRIQGGEIDISRFKKTIRTCHICRIGRAERERISGRHMLTTARETVRTAHPAYRKIEWKQVIRQTENDASRQLTCLHRRPNAATKNFDRHLHEFHHCRVLSINTFRRQII